MAAFVEIVFDNSDGMSYKIFRMCI